MTEVEILGAVRHISVAASGFIHGRNIELRKTHEEYIQWRVVGDEEWITLFSLEDLRMKLVQGLGERTDVAMSQKAVTDAFKRLGGGIELRTEQKYLQWRPIGETEWINMVPLSELGPDIVQTTGVRTDAVMSQKAVTDALGEIGGSGPGWVPDYQTFVFKQAEVKPDKPAVTTTYNLNNEAGGYWKDYPNTPDSDWWQCIGVVDGTKREGEEGFIKSWSEPFPNQGVPGKDGKVTEFRWCDVQIGQELVFVEEQRGQRIPEGWTMKPGVLWAGYARWQTHAVIAPDGTEFGVLEGWWSEPYKVSGEDGKPGLGGMSLRIKYQRTDSAVTPPVLNADDPDNPGSQWESSSNVGSGRYLWVITATIRPDGSLAGIWQGPELMTGQAGSVPNYKIYVYKVADSKPEMPTITTTDDLNNEAGGYWKDYPDTPGNWWQCVGTVDGTKQRGEEGFIVSWSNTYPFNGRDGVAQDGKYTELRWLDVTKGAIPTLTDTERRMRMPTGWTKQPSALNDGDYRWEIHAIILPDDSIEGELWSVPYRISGEDGRPGAPGADGKDGKDVEFVFKRTGEHQRPDTPESTNTDDYVPSSWTDDPVGVSAEYIYEWVSKRVRRDGTWQAYSLPALWAKYAADGGPGIAGIPGVAIEMRYSIGPASGPIATSPEGTKTRQPEGWSIALPSAEVSEENPYIWFTQARIVYTGNQEVVENPYAGGSVSGDGWEKPARLSGTNGTNGGVGSKGPIAYPAGLYSTDKSYVCTATTAPYVCDGGDNNFYVLDYPVGEPWIGNNQQYKTPHEVVAAGLKHWVKVDAFEALYAKIGIIANGLIGSAVFNGDYVFSQQGVDQSSAASSNYEDFDPDNPYDGVFIPNIMLNLRTGGGHLAAGKVRFYDGGATELVDVKVKGDILQTLNPVYPEHGVTSMEVQCKDLVVGSFYTSAPGTVPTPIIGEIILHPTTRGVVNTYADWSDLQIGKAYKMSVTNIGSGVVLITIAPPMTTAFEVVYPEKFRGTTQSGAMINTAYIDGVLVNQASSLDLIFIPRYLDPLIDGQAFVGDWLISNHVNYKLVNDPDNPERCYAMGRAMEV